MRYAGDDPVPLADALSVIGADLGLAPAAVARRLDECWPEIVGRERAAHAHLDAVREGAVTITVDDPIWATQLRYLEAEIRARIRDAVGCEVVSRVVVRVRR